MEGSPLVKVTSSPKKVIKGGLKIASKVQFVFPMGRRFFTSSKKAQINFEIQFRHTATESIISKIYKKRV